MILKDMDFTEFYKHIEGIFCNHFSEKETQVIMDFVYILSDANFRCYKANMIVIKSRKENENNDKLIANMEWVARSVGEYRVSSKARINNYITLLNPKTNQAVTSANKYGWVSDDVVYSVGEMMDRLSIEFIKREDFSKNNRPDYMRKSSQELSDRVEWYLRAKLQEIYEKGYYESIHEQRTYDLEGIVEELVI